MRLLERWAAELDSVLAAPGTWRPVPTVADRDAWTAVAERQGDFAARIVALAEAVLGSPWTSLRASDAMRFARDGDRSAYQALVDGRRRRLSLAVLAECLEGRGRFLDEVVDGAWLICEESSWCSPAHWHLAILPRRPPQLLPRQDRELVDISAAETALLLAESLALLRGPLEALSPVLGERIRSEVRRRCIAPVLAFDDWFWWPGQHNWSVWIAANLLGAGSYLLDEPDVDRWLVRRCLGIIDRFTAGYGDDGACDEGPGYWSHACGSLLLALELLHDRSAGRCDAFAEPRFRAMGRYIECLRLGGRQFATFADCPPAPALPVAKVWRLGDRLGDGDLLALGQALAREQQEPSAHLVSDLRRLWWCDPLRAPGLAAPRPLAVWLPSREILVARTTPADDAPLSLAVKAGSNAESHNHNDVGQLIVRAGGRPLIVDPGTGTYQRSHFSPDRYAIWTQNHQGHNPPVLGGVGQQAATGWGFVQDDDEPAPLARSVTVADDGALLAFSCDAAACYPRRLGVRLAQRQVQLQRLATRLLIRDTVRLAEGPLDYATWWWLAERPEQLGDDRWAWADGWTIRIEGATGSLSERVLEDAQLIAAWGPRLWRLECRARTPGAELVVELVLAREPA